MPATWWRMKGMLLLTGVRVLEPTAELEAQRDAYLAYHASFEGGAE